MSHSIFTCKTKVGYLLRIEDNSMDEFTIKFQDRLFLSNSGRKGFIDCFKIGRVIDNITNVKFKPNNPIIHKY